MNTNLRIGLMGLIGAFAGFALQGCFAAQPVPECTVNTTAVASSHVPYYVLLEKVDSTGPGTCGDLDHMYAGLTRYRTEANGGAFTVAIKTNLLADPYQGSTYAADVDDYNNCVNEEDCQGADDPTYACVVNQPDGGVELNDGTPVDPMDGTVTDPGGDYQVDLENECGPVDDAVARVDPTDPDGKNVVAIGAMPQFPTAGRCTLTDFKGGVQNFEEVPVLSGSALPAVTHKIEFSNFIVINTTDVNGTAFTADMKYTEGSCVANYKAKGFWSGLAVAIFGNGTPEIPCDVAGQTTGLHYAPECDPNADVDAGRSFGSGMAPAFEPKCDVVRKACVPSVDFATLQ